MYTITAHDLSNPSSPSNGFQWTGGGSPIHIPSLVAGDSYNFTVTATNAHGQGPDSAPVEHGHAGECAGRPRPALAARRVCFSASVTFTAPADNGSPISYYTITAYDQTNPLDPSNGHAVGRFSGSPITKPSLTGGHTYTFTVSASNGIGQGPDSCSVERGDAGERAGCSYGIGCAIGGRGQRECELHGSVRQWFADLVLHRSRRTTRRTRWIPSNGHPVGRSVVARSPSRSLTAGDTLHVHHLAIERRRSGTGVGAVERGGRELGHEACVCRPIIVGVALG